MFYYHSSLGQCRVRILLFFPFVLIERSRFTTLSLCANGEVYCSSLFYYSSSLCQWRFHLLLLFLFVPMESSRFSTLPLCANGEFTFTTLRLCANGEFTFYYSFSLC